MFDILDHLHDTAEGLDGIPAWFLRVGAPFFAAPIADIMNLSLATSVVPVQWKKASILPIAKITVPQTPADFRPISITPVLSRILERIVVKEFIYPSLQSPPSNLDFSDQYAFQPTASTTAALIQLFQTITDLLEINSYVIVLVLDFSKAFDTVRHHNLIDKYSSLGLPDNIYNWIDFSRSFSLHKIQQPSFRFSRDFGKYNPRLSHGTRILCHHSIRSSHCHTRKRNGEVC